MTEAEWLTCHFSPQIAYLRGRVSDRKLRLIACGYCRFVWNQLVHETCRQAVEVAERHADGAASDDDLRCAQAQAVEAVRGAEALGRGQVYVGGAATSKCASEAAEETIQRAIGAREFPLKIMTAAEWENYGTECLSEVRALLQDVAGNPFRPVTFSPSWRTSTVLALSHQMYDSRDFSAMPILADALQDAGCDTADVLNHCRGPGPHVRGCWVVDLVLGKS